MLDRHDARILRVLERQTRNLRSCPKLPARRRNAVPTLEPWQIDELRLLFSSPVFVDGARPKGGRGEAAFWLPLLAACAWPACKLCRERRTAAGCAEGSRKAREAANGERH